MKCWENIVKGPENLKKFVQSKWKLVNNLKKFQNLRANFRLIRKVYKNKKNLEKLLKLWVRFEKLKNLLKFWVKVPKKFEKIRRNKNFKNNNSK